MLALYMANVVSKQMFITYIIRPYFLLCNKLLVTSDYRVLRICIINFFLFRQQRQFTEC